jgi:ATP-dependent helicase HrpA
MREVDTWLAGLPPDRRADPAVREVPWLVEELRVSLFAQQLGTPAPISAKRIYKTLDTLG